jgi:single-strand DNA-binding protein
VAVTRRWKDRNGERQQDTTWVNCVAWEPVSKIVEKHVRKGDPILLEGRWTNEKGKDGVTYSKVTVENLYLLPRREQSPPAHDGHQRGNGYDGPDFGDDGGWADNDPADVPF